MGQKRLKFKSALIKIVITPMKKHVVKKSPKCFLNSSLWYPVYRIKLLRQLLENCKSKTSNLWEEMLIITHEDEEYTLLSSVEQTLEDTFYNQALCAATKAIRRFNDSRQSWLG